MTVLAVLVRSGSDLLDVARLLVAGRADPVWRPRVLGTVAIWFAAVIALGYGVVNLRAGAQPFVAFVAVPIAVVDAVAVVLAVRRPLAAWRLTMLSLLVSPFLVMLHPAVAMLGLPWAQSSALLHLVVVLLLALAVPGRATALVVAIDAVVVGVAVMPDGPSAAISAVAIAALVVGLVGALGTALRAQRLATAGLDDARRNHAEERIRRTAVEERAHIARDLHDVVAHHLSAIAVRAESAPDRVRGTAGLEAELQTIAEAARTALTDMRRLLQVLRDEDTGRQHEPAPDLDQLHELVDAMRASGVEVVFEERGQPRPLPAAVGLVGYRVAQEALSNAARHATGAPVTVLLHWLPLAVRLQVENGPGTAEPGGDAGHGLIGMRERVAAVGGLLVAGPRPDGGFLVDMTVTT